MNFFANADNEQPKEFCDYKQPDALKKNELLSQLLPQQIYCQRWRMSKEAINNTMSYIFDKMRHPCYLVGIKHHKIYFYKLKPEGGTAPEFIPIIKRDLQNLNKNPLLNNKQINAIKDAIDPLNVRVMQCIVKTFDEHPEAIAAKTTRTENPDTAPPPEKNNEYYDFLMDLLGEIIKCLDNGLFIFNLTDAIILREDGTEPFPYAYGANKTMNDKRYVWGDFLPILGGGQKGYLDIPMPNYDEIIRIVDKIPVPNYNTNWSKKIAKAVFRGGPTGCGASAETNMRLKLSQLSKHYAKKPGHPMALLDACVIGRGDRSIKYDPKYGLSKIRQPDIFVAMCENQKGIPMLKQSDYKYIVHVDGNINAYRLLNTMLTGSLILRVKSPYIHWADHLLKPGVHYIQIAEDLSNLGSVLNWCMKNDGLCAKIAQRGREAALLYISSDFLREVFMDYLNFLSRHCKPTQQMPLLLHEPEPVIDLTPPPLPPTPPAPAPQPTKEKSEPIIVQEPAQLPQTMLDDDFIPMPQNNRCPAGYNRTKLADGTLVCRKKVPQHEQLPTFVGPSTSQLPQQAARLTDIVDKIAPQDFVPWVAGKKCPKNYNVMNINGTKVCKRKQILLGGGAGRKTRKRNNAFRAHGGNAIPTQEQSMADKFNLQTISQKELATKIANFFIS